jgi:hypothetical protein
MERPVAATRRNRKEASILIAVAVLSSKIFVARRP